MVRIFLTRAIPGRWNHLDSIFGAHKTWKDKGQATPGNSYCQKSFLQSHLPSNRSKQTSSPEYSVALGNCCDSTHRAEHGVCIHGSKDDNQPCKILHRVGDFVKCQLTALHSLCHFLQYLSVPWTCGIGLLHWNPTQHLFTSPQWPTTSWKKVNSLWIYDPVAWGGLT